MRIIYLFALLPLACATGDRLAYTRDTATQINGDRRYAHASDGTVIDGPFLINERVFGERDAAGNVHVATDQWFIQRAAALTRTQLSLASLAWQRGASPDVLALSDHLAAENQRIDERVRKLAAERRVALSDRLPLEESGTVTQLASLSGEAFDRAYVTEAQRLDREQLRLWDDALRSTNDGQVSQFASESLPTLRAAHRQAADTRVRM